MFSYNTCPDNYLRMIKIKGMKNTFSIQVSEFPPGLISTVRQVFLNALRSVLVGKV